MIFDNHICHHIWQYYLQYFTLSHRHRDNVEFNTVDIHCTALYGCISVQCTNIWKTHHKNFLEALHPIWPQKITLASPSEYLSFGRDVKPNTHLLLPVYKDNNICSILPFFVVAIFDQNICRATSSGVPASFQKTKADQNCLLSKPAA